MSPEEARRKATMLQYTSGISTGSSKHSKEGGHSNPLGYGFDLSTGKQWKKKEWDLALPIIQQVYAQRGIDIFYEDERGHKFVNPTDENAAFAHIHAQPKGAEKGGFRYIRTDWWNKYAGIREKNAIALEEAKAKAQAAGAKVVSSVSAKTDYVVVGINPGSKQVLAEKLQVLQISEKEFNQILDEEEKKR
jgi:hypothetical protein